MHDTAESYSAVSMPSVESDSGKEGKSKGAAEFEVEKERGRIRWPRCTVDVVVRRGEKENQRAQR